MVGQAGALVGFDDHVVGLVGGLDQEVQAHHRYFQGPRGLDRGLAEGRMEGVGDVLEDAAGVQVGGAPHGQVFAAGQHVVVAIAGGPQGALGLVVERDAAFPAGGGLAPAALRLDQLADAVPTVADHRGGTTDGGGHHLVADHQHAQVVAGVVALQQHARIEMAGGLDGLLDLFRGAQVHRHALALLAVHRLDHQRTVLGEERGVFLRAAGQALLRLAQAGVLQGAVGEDLVLAEGHAYRRGQVGERFTAADLPAALGQGEQAALGVVDAHLDAAPVGLVDDDPGVGVEVFLRAGAEEQRLVDAVLALDGEGRQFAEAELAVERLGLLVVVQHREVEVGQFAAHEVLDQVPHQRLADARPAALRVHRQAPEAGAPSGSWNALAWLRPITVPTATPVSASSASQIGPPWWRGLRRSVCTGSMPRARYRRLIAAQSSSVCTRRMRKPRGGRRAGR